MSLTLPGTTARPEPGQDDVRDTYHRLVAELRDVEHWRRLVAARLDLAVAAVTDIDEPVGHPVDGAVPPPTDLRGLLGIPCGDDACGEAANLLRLRTVLADLDAYARALRPGVAAAARAAGVPRARTVPRRRLTAVPAPDAAADAAKGTVPDDAPAGPQLAAVPAPPDAGTAPKATPVVLPAQRRPGRES